MPRPRNATAGFSLVELLISLAIIGIMSAAIAPSIGEMVADNRQASASIDLVRMSRKARALTLATGNAYLLRYQVGPARARLARAVRGHEQQVPADAVGRRPSPRRRAAGCARSRRSTWLIYNPKTSSNPTVDDTGRQVIAATAKVNASVVNEVQICYQPDGEVYTAVPPATLARQQQALPVLFRVLRAVNGTSHGQIREIVFPAGGTARAR